MKLKFSKIIQSGLFLGIFCIASASAEVRKITPPKLGEAHLGKKILCHRPMRRGSPMLSVDKVGDKVIANNYGHGGSGWTLGPGSAKYVIRLLQQEIGKEPKSTPIAVVGAGALGLFSTIELLDRGYTNITIIAESFDDLTSHNAGGLLAPVSMDNDVKMQKIIDEIGIDAYEFYAQVAAGKHPFIKYGARIVPTYFPDREDSGLEPYVGKVMKPAKDVTLDFGNGTQRKMVSYDDGIFMDTGGLMIQMKAYLEGLSKAGAEKGIKIGFVKRKINDFREVDQKIIVNCTGLGAAKLHDDEQLVPVQGHLIMLKDQNPKDLEHMILVYFGKNKTKSGFDVKRSFYIFPKQLPGSPANDVGVVGGTFIEGADATHPNEEEFEIMLNGAKKFYGIKE